MDISPQEILLTASLVILFVIMIRYYAKSRKRFAKMLFGFFSGIAVLYPTTLIIAAFGGTLSMNLFTLTVSGILGIPGVALLATATFL